MAIRHPAMITKKYVDCLFIFASFLTDKSAPLQHRIVAVRCQFIGFFIASRLSMAALIASWRLQMITFASFGATGWHLAALLIRHLTLLIGGCRPRTRTVLPCHGDTVTRQVSGKSGMRTPSLSNRTRTIQAGQGFQGGTHPPLNRRLTVQGRLW